MDFDLKMNFSWNLQNKDGFVHEKQHFPLRSSQSYEKAQKLQQS
jgi:hypothetical protein